MIKVNILSKFDRDRFIRQLNKNIYTPENYYFAENSNERIVWDIVIVFDGINKPQNLQVKQGGLIFISGEPPSSVTYPRNFTNQFDWVISSHNKIKHPRLCLMQQALNWHYAYNRTNKTYSKNFEDLEKMPCPQKNKAISIITSSQKMMPGHNRRMILIDKLKSTFGNQISLFGKGFHYIDDKKEALDDYYFHLCIENSNVDHYWTEKIADPLLGYCLPIYIGAPNITTYFDKNGLMQFEINDLDGITTFINKVLKDPEKEYKRCINGLIKNREKLLHDYNIFPYIIKFYKENIVTSEIIKNVTIERAEDFFEYKPLQYKLRLKRLIYKIYINHLKIK